MQPQIQFLERPSSLAKQVAELLLEGITAYPIDLGNTQVWVPTADAGRRIRFALAELTSQKGTGVLSPRFLQPMQALLPENGPENIAERSEREAAWAKAILQSSNDQTDRLLPNADLRDSVSGLLGAGGLLCDLSDLLVEGAFTPEDPTIAKLCEEDASRWKQLGELYGKYLGVLQNAGLSDPNELRIQMLTDVAPANYNRVVVACIPDLPSISVQYLEQLLNNGVTVTVLVWRPKRLAARIDDWGRPRSDDWKTASLPIQREQIQVTRQAQDEACFALDFLSDAETPGDYAIALADESLAPTFSAEIIRRGGIPFSPGGKKLSDTEAATIAGEWEKFKIDGDLRILRNLLQGPRFLNWLCTACDLTPSQMLAACDFLISKVFAETLNGARAYFAADEHQRNDHFSANAHAARQIISTLESASTCSVTQLLREAWREEHSSSSGTEKDQVLEILSKLADSPLFSEWPDARDAAFTRALRTVRTFNSSPVDAVELVGWLETPWLEGSRVAVCGCVEGSLPGSVNEHAFLPDSKRKLLGLLDNDRRLARDAYLLNCLFERTNIENLKLTFSKFGADGSPSLPSRLLMQCSPTDLPGRVRHVFGEVSVSRAQPSRKNSWLWKLPENLRNTEITKISPTAFKDYLACPFRFYWKHILRRDAFDADPRELDAGRFGQLVHSTLEAFGRVAPDEGNASKIEVVVLEQFEKEVIKMLGSTPISAVRVQLEAIKVRLRAFARLQAQEFAAGWRIIDVEKRFSADEVDALKVGPLPLSAQVDRIEQHPEFGMRIMDYKTFSTVKTPETTHFGSATTNDFLPEAKVSRNQKERCWIDLQLPLYRAIAEKHYAIRFVQTAYFVLPSDPGQTSITPFLLSDLEYESAMNCARAVAEKVGQGVFWPPQSYQASWVDPLGPLFLNGRPGDCLDTSTIEFFRGRL